MGNLFSKKKNYTNTSKKTVIKLSSTLIVVLITYSSKQTICNSYEKRGCPHCCKNGIQRTIQIVSDVEQYDDSDSEGDVDNSINYCTLCKKTYTFEYDSIDSVVSSSSDTMKNDNKNNNIDCRKSTCFYRSEKICESCDFKCNCGKCIRRYYIDDNCWIFFSDMVVVKKHNICINCMNKYILVEINRYHIYVRYVIYLQYRDIFIKYTRVQKETNIIVYKNSKTILK